MQGGRRAVGVLSVCRRHLGPRESAAGLRFFGGAGAAERIRMRQPTPYKTAHRDRSGGGGNEGKTSDMWKQAKPQGNRPPGPGRLTQQLAHLQHSGQLRRMKAVVGGLLEAYGPVLREKDLLHLLQAMGKEGELAGAKSLLCSMEHKYRVAPTVHHYGCVIGHLCKRGLSADVVAAAGLLRRMKRSERPEAQPNVVTYTSLVAGYARLGDMDAASRLMAEMRERRLAPNVATYTALISGYFRARMPLEAEKALARMREEGMEPNGRTFCTILVGLSNTEAAEGASRLAEEMRQRGIRPDAVAYNALIAALFRVGDEEAAMQWVGEAYGHGVRLNEVSLAAMAMCYATHEASGDTEATLERLRRMLGTEQSGTVFNSMYMKVLCALGRTDEARNLLEEQSRAGGLPPVSAYHRLISALARSGGAEAAEEVLEMFLGSEHEPVRYIFNAVVHGYCRSGDMASATRVVGRMQQSGSKPDEFTFSHLIRAYADAGDLDTAEQLFQRMMKAGHAPNESIFRAIINGHLAQDQVDTAGKLAEEMIRMDVTLREPLSRFWAHVGEVCGVAFPQKTRRRAKKAAWAADSDVLE